MKKPAIIIDLDGTLCNADHRKYFVETKDKKDWRSFYESLVEDQPNNWCVELVNSMRQAGYQIIFVTGRPAEYLPHTRDWIELKLKLVALKDYLIFTRPSGDMRKDSVVKEEIYRDYIEHNFDVLFCVDDRKQVVDMWRSLGLTCLQCSEGDF